MNVVRRSHGTGVVNGVTRGRSIGSWWTRAKFVLVIGIAVLVDNLSSEMELVYGDGILVGGSNADELDGGSMPEELLGVTSIGWDTPDGGKDMRDMLS